MSTALDAVVSRILADPDDDVARLDAATIFDATDPPRARHIRLSIEAQQALIAHFIAEPDSPHPPRLDAWAQLAELEEEHGARWREPLAHLDDPAIPYPACRLDRGFIGSVRVRAEDLAAHAETLAQHPIATLQLEDRASPVSLAQVLEQPLLQRVSSLHLGQRRLTDADYEALAACPPLHRCELIVFDWAPIYDPQLALLASSPQLRCMMLSLHSETQRTVSPNGYWLTVRAAKLEAEHGPIRWFRPIWPAETYLGPRLTHRLRAAGVTPAEVPLLGTFQELSYHGLSDTGFAEVTRILDARGYQLSGKGRLHYGYTKDGAAGWSGWTYFLDVTEYSDAPIAEEIQVALAKGW